MLMVGAGLLFCQVSYCPLADQLANFPCAPQYSTSDTVSNSVTTEQSFSTTCTLPSGFFTNNKVLKVWLGFDTSTVNITTALTLKMKLGTTVVYQSLSVGSNANAATSGGCSFVLQGTATAGTIQTTILSNTGTAAASSNIAYPCTRNTLTTQTTGVGSGPYSLNFTGTWNSTTGAESITLTQLIVEALN
jgi:hypothetical protein